MLADWLALNSVPGLGPVRIAHLIQQFGSPESVLDLRADRIAQASGLSTDAVQPLKNGDALESAKRQIEMADHAGVTILTIDDSRYPGLLKEIFAPPPVLFVKGRMEVFTRHAVGVVGTRMPTQYGRQAASVLARQLTQARMVVVSGLALGIDSVAHEACLSEGGWTIAVLGTGIDDVYPRSNKRLAADIVERGALVSEFPPSTPPHKYNFPRRNRIISGLSAGVLVVEAGKHSGSLITANYALQQGRDVFAVPGPIFSDKSAGTFELIKNGATPVQCGAEIVESVQTLTILPPQPGQVTAAFPEELLSEEERIVFGHISATPIRFDQILENYGCDPSALPELLLGLELKGAIRQISGLSYVRS